MEIKNSMKKLIVLILTSGLLPCLCAQELLSKEEAQTYAQLTRKNPKLLESTPVKCEVDIANPVALREGDYGGMLLTDKNFTAEKFGKLGEKRLPVAEFWLYHLGPMRNGELVSDSELNIIALPTDDGTVKVPLCILGVVKNNQDKLELQVFGKEKKPILQLPLKAINEKQTTPVAVSAERESESGTIIVKLFGKHEARFQVTELLLD
jgi:hypothetical protein